MAGTSCLKYDYVARSNPFRVNEVAEAVVEERGQREIDK